MLARPGAVVAAASVRRHTAAAGVAAARATTTARALSSLGARSGGSSVDGVGKAWSPMDIALAMGPRQHASPRRSTSTIGRAAVPGVVGGRQQSRQFRSSAIRRKQNELYDRLGVDPSSSQGDIKKAYYKLAKKYHPDANPGDDAAQKKFADISAAYETLGDDNSRAQYDAAGGFEPGEGGGFGGGGGDGGFGGFGNPEDLFANIFGNRGGGGRGGSSPRRGADVQMQMDISFEDAVSGVSRQVGYENRVTCEECNGLGAQPGSKSFSACPVCSGSGVETMTMNGFLQYQSTCRKCGGTGTIITDPCKPCRGRGYRNQNHTVDVEVPAGVDDGMEMRVLNQGHAGENGGPAGSLYVQIRVKPSRVFERSGANISSVVEISLAQALLGGTIGVKGVHGDMNLKVKAGTESGKQYRLRGRGMPRIKSSSRGDHFVQFKVAIPTELTDRQRELIMQWAAEDAERASGSVAGLNEYLEAKEAAAAAAAADDDDDDDSDGNGNNDGNDDGNNDDACEGGMFQSIFGGSKKDKRGS